MADKVFRLLSETECEVCLCLVGRVKLSVNVANRNSEYEWAKHCQLSKLVLVGLPDCVCGLPSYARQVHLACSHTSLSLNSLSLLFYCHAIFRSKCDYDWFCLLRCDILFCCLSVVKFTIIGHMPLLCDPGHYLLIKSISLFRIS